jgi:hypothetical protein
VLLQENAGGKAELYIDTMNGVNLNFDAKSIVDTWYLNLVVLTVGSRFLEESLDNLRGGWRITVHPENLHCETWAMQSHVPGSR